MSGKRIDFKYLREHADFIAVLEHYGLHPEKDGHKEGQHKATCPFHNDTDPSLKVNTTKNIYNCFVCDAGGNVLEFVTHMESGDPDVSADLRMGASELANICGIETAPISKPRSKTAKKSSKSRKAEKTSVAARSGTKPEHPAETEASVNTDAQAEDLDGLPYNPPLSFELKKLDTEHPFFGERDIESETIECFGLGVAERGMFKGRLAIPIHNVDGELVAYCGRYPSNDIPDGEAKYLLPPRFRKDLEVYNLNRVLGHEHAVLVESYISVWRLDGYGVPAVSCMGRSISSQQVDLLKGRGVKYVTVMFDGDDPGRRGAEPVALTLARVGVWVRVVDLPDRMKPHHITTPDAIKPFDLPHVLS